jgi:nucleoside-diphosphate-sugar epimerase
MALKVLFIGGSGIISSACSALAVEQGIDLYLFNRGQTGSLRPIPEGATVLTGDIHHPPDMQRYLDEFKFDVVVDWIAFLPQDVQRDIETFNGKVGQYVFISSASAYQKPIQHLPITEETPLVNPFWQYSRDKAACEQTLMEAYQKDGFPVTIVRPSHTYDKTLLPFQGGYTFVQRMRQGKPVIIHGDGTSLWVLTHHKDFAVGFNGLLGNDKAIGEAFQITSDMLLSWNQIYLAVAEAAGESLKPVYIPSTVINKYDSNWGAGLLGDKAYSVIFDNTKIKSLVPEFNPQIPWSQGSREVIAWYDRHPEYQVVDETFDQLVDKIIAEVGYPV